MQSSNYSLLQITFYIHVVLTRCSKLMLEVNPLPPKANGSFSQISKYRLPAYV